MTREEAIAILTDKIKPCLTLTDWEVAIDMAIEALGNKPTPCEKCIHVKSCRTCKLIKYYLRGTGRREP